MQQVLRGPATPSVTPGLVPCGPSCGQEVPVLTSVCHV